ncbi:MAG: L,D-transpeptidase family protein, partial [Clostridium sp.]
RTVADLEEDGCYINPTAYASDLTKDCEQMNDLTDVVVTYDFSDRKETVDRSVIKGMLGRDENDNLVVSKDAVAAYVADLAGKYDTAGTERTFSTYDNRDITVSGGNYGWVIDQQKESNALYKDITEKKTEVREPVYEQKAASRKINDIGYSYIEIDLSAQRMVLYQSGSPVVDTGLVADSSTPTGIYALGEKESSAVPGGGAGETVNFWMPFTDKIGIYGKAGLDVTGYDFSDDADIAAFGSDDESSGTSVFSDSWPGIEGCIAVPEEQAQAIYQTVESGIPVVIYK